MMSTTHALYARKVRDHILLKYGIKLKTASLVYGSVKPDMSTIFAKYPHYIDKSLDMLCERFNILYSSIDNIDELYTRAFARELGVGLHYISDYFCKVHNDINGIRHIENLKHVRYEHKLQKYIKYNKLDETREKIINKVDENSIKIKNRSLKAFIKGMNNKYKREAGKIYLYDNTKKHYELDILYSYEMVLTIADYLILSIIQK